MSTPYARIEAARQAGVNMRQQQERESVERQLNQLALRERKAALAAEEARQKREELEAGQNKALTLQEALRQLPTAYQDAKPPQNVAPTVIPPAATNPVKVEVNRTVPFPTGNGETIDLPAPSKQQAERLGVEAFVKQRNLERMFGEDKIVRPGEGLFRPGVGFIAENTTATGDMTPEENFIGLYLRNQAVKSGGKLSPADELRARGEARREWNELSRNPAMEAIRLEIAELQKEAAQQKLDGAGTLSPQQMTQALSLSNSLKGHPAYTDMLDIDTGMKGVQVGLQQDNGFGDITAINAFQRMVDPGATVREGDVGLLQSASALVDRILSEYPIERLKTGAKLPDTVRDRMLKTAEQLYATRANNYNDTIGNQYRLLASGAGVPFEFIGQTFKVDSGAPKTIEQMTDEELKALAGGGGN